MQIKGSFRDISLFNYFYGFSLIPVNSFYSLIRLGLHPSLRCLRYFSNRTPNDTY